MAETYARDEDGTVHATCPRCGKEAGTARDVVRDGAVVVPGEMLAQLALQIHLGASLSGTCQAG